MPPVRALSTPPGSGPPTPPGGALRRSTTARPATGAADRSSRGRRRLIRAAILGLVALLLASLPWLWTTTAARGHLYGEADAPAADVVIVLGTRWRRTAVAG